LFSTLPPPTVPNTSPVESTNIFVPASDGVLPTVSTNGPQQTAVLRRKARPVFQQIRAEQPSQFFIPKISTSLSFRRRFTLPLRLELRQHYCRFSLRPFWPGAASVKQRRISSPVAGKCNCLAAVVETQPSACFTAVHTHVACISGGSPTALLLATFSVLSSLGNSSPVENRRHVRSRPEFC